MVFFPPLFHVALSAYVSIAGLAFFGQDFFQYRPTHEDAHGIARAPFIPWRSDTGEFLAYLRPSDDVKRVVVFFHGMGGEAMNWHWYDRIVPQDHMLVLAEYPGYGARAGKPSQTTLFDAADDLVQRVRARWRAPLTIVGESLGSGVATYVASRHAIERLALVAPFSSVTDVVRHHAPFLPVATLLRDQYPSMTYVKDVHVPLHILHGTDDAVIPVALGRKLFEAYPGVQKTFSELAGFNHYSINTALTRSKLTQSFRLFMAGEDSELLTHQ